MAYFQKPIIITLIVFGLLLNLPGVAIAVPATSQIPLDSWVYSALDKISALGLVNSSLQGIRPYTRFEAARQVEEALTAAQFQDVSPAIHALLGKLERELGDTLTDLREGSSAGFLKLREVQLKYVYQNGDESTIAGNGVVAGQHPLNYNNYGLNYQEQNAQLILQGETRLGGFFLIDLRPLILFQTGDDDDADVTLFDGRAVAQLGSFEVSVGRQSLWWGQGRHGSLVLTNNAKPLDMIRITNSTPFLLPWFLKYLGPFRFDVFWSRVEKDRSVEKPYFAGLRIDTKPLPWIELGASRTVMFGGKGRPHVDWNDFITILGGKNLSGGEDTSNSIAALDVRLLLPFLWNAEVYGEYGGEDEAGHFIANTAWLAGLYLPKIDPSGRLSLRLEQADLSQIDDNSPVWYRHGIYRSGYTYEGVVMGHHVGGGAKDTLLEVEAMLSENLLLTVGFDYEERGFDQPVHEKYKEISTSLSWDLTEHLNVDCSARYGKVDNFDFKSGNSENVSLISVGLRGHW